LEQRLISWVGKVVRRKPSSEARVAAALRVAAPHCAKLRVSLLEAVAVLIGRGSFDRPLYGAAIRALADAGERRLPPLVAEALAGKSSGGLATLAAAASCNSVKVGEALARSASNKHPEIAFAAALAQRLRAEGEASLLLSAAARLKESARIELCTELLAPLVLVTDAEPELPRGAAPAMKVLRDAERHLGRWLVFARAGLACDDASALVEADARAKTGSSSARAAWSLLAWALASDRSIPEVRPTTEIVARLSDRPTSERDMSFLFRLADVRAPAASGLLESMGSGPLSGPDGVRAAAELARQYDIGEALDPVVRLLDEGKHGELHGLAVAALWSGGRDVEARQRAERLSEARSLSVCLWGGLVLKGRRLDGPLISESRFRRLERGMVQ